MTGTSVMEDPAVEIEKEAHNRLIWKGMPVSHSGFDSGGAFSAWTFGFFWFFYLLLGALDLGLRVVVVQPLHNSVLCTSWRGCSEI